jgi:hypothetical protein
LNDHPWDVKNPQDYHVDVHEEVEHWHNEVEYYEVLNCKHDSVEEIKHPGEGNCNGKTDHHEESDNEKDDVDQPSWKS